MVISLHVAVTHSITCQAHKEKMGDGGGRGAWEVQHWWDEAWNWNFIIHSHNTGFPKLKAALQGKATRKKKEKASLLWAAKYIDAPASASLLYLNSLDTF